MFLLLLFIGISLIFLFQIFPDSADLGWKRLGTPVIYISSRYGSDSPFILTCQTQTTISKLCKYILRKDSSSQTSP
jgi:hypothetical protein